MDSLDVQLRNREEKCQANIIRLENEMIQSEKAYINYLRLITRFFDVPLKMKKYFEDDIHEQIFGHVRTILSLSESLFDYLNQFGVAAAFRKLAPWLKLYSDYAKNHRVSANILQKLKVHDKNLLQFLAMQEKDPLVNQTLQSLLLMPIQRIPRYEMILRELLVNNLILNGVSPGLARDYVISTASTALQATTFPMHKLGSPKKQSMNSSANPDGRKQFQAITKELNASQVDLVYSLAEMVETANYLNEQVRLYEQGEFAASLQKRLTGRGSDNLLIAPGRYLIRYALLKQKIKSKTRTHHILIILMSDILVYATPIIITPTTGEGSPRRKKQFLFNLTSHGSFSAPSVLHFPKHACHSYPGQGNSHNTCDSDASTTDQVAFEENFDPLKDAVFYSNVCVLPLHQCMVHLFSTKRQESGLSGLAVSSLSTDHHLKNKDDTCDSDCRNYFTVACQSTHLFLQGSKDTETDLWAKTIAEAVEYCLLARQSLRKTSTAKHPLPVNEFVKLEQSKTTSLYPTGMQMDLENPPPYLSKTKFQRHLN